MVEFATLHNQEVVKEIERGLIEHAPYDDGQVDMESITEFATRIALMAAHVFGGKNALFWAMQIATFAVLILAANTAYADFPRLASLIAKDGYLPRQFSFRGDRLAYSWGILILSAVAGLFIVLFDGSVTALIPMYSVFSQGLQNYDVQPMLDIFGFRLIDLHCDAVPEIIQLNGQPHVANPCLNPVAFGVDWGVPEVIIGSAGAIGRNFVATTTPSRSWGGIAASVSPTIRSDRPGP